MALLNLKIKNRFELDSLRVRHEVSEPERSFCPNELFFSVPFAFSDILKAFFREYIFISLSARTSTKAREKKRKRKAKYFMVNMDYFLLCLFGIMNRWKGEQVGINELIANSIATNIPWEERDKYSPCHIWTSMQTSYCVPTNVQTRKKPYQFGERERGRDSVPSLPNSII